MLKKNTRKRLLAGALATVMMLTMCPSWALADVEDGIAPLPANEEIAVPVDDSTSTVVDSTPAADPTETPAVPTPSETEDQNTAPAPSDDGANGGTDSTETGNNNASSDVSEDSKNNSQNNDVVSNSPENEMSVQELSVDFALWEPQPQKAMYFILLPKRGTPKNNKNQGQENYLPSSYDKATGTPGRDGGVWGLSADTGYEGFLTKAGKNRVRYLGNSVTDIANGVDKDYLDVPTNLGFFTEKNWDSNGNYTLQTNTDGAARNALLGEGFNGTGFEIVWYTIKHEVDGYHVDGYLKGVPVNVTYHSNFGDDATYVDTATTGDEYQALTTYSATNLPERQGYTFDGWYKDVNCTEVYEPTTLMGDLHLYAKWVKTSYNVEYYVDNQKIASESSVKVNTPVTVSSTTPTKEGYTFKCWTTNDVTVNDGTFIMPNNDVRFDAVFEINKYTVTWLNDDGTEVGTETVDYNKTPNSNPTVSKASDAQFDYQFAGWKLEGDADTALVEPNKRKVTENVTYVAVFTPVARKYTVTYKVDKEIYTIDGADQVFSYHYGDSVPLAAKPTRDGFTFNGWGVPEGVSFDATGTSFTMPAKNVVIEGTFSANEYTVTYKVDGKIYTINDEKQVFTYHYGDNVPLAAKPTRDGFNFNGWLPEGVALNVTGTGFQMPANDVVIRGTFDANSFYVAYYVDGILYASELHKTGAKVTIRGDLAKDGFTFSGWTRDNVKAENFDMPAHNVEIHGSYRQNTHQYTIKKHFYDEKGVEIAELASTTPASGAENAPIAGLYKKDAVNQTVNEKNYVYVSALTTVTPAGEKLTKDVTIDLHYYLDVEGGEKPGEIGNGTPDAWEYRLTFKVVNGEWNNGGNADIVVYVQSKNNQTGEALENVWVPLTRIPFVGEKPNSGYHAGSWDTTLDGNTTVKKDTVFTYTYAKDSSSGSSGGSGGGHHRKPTVTIPDEVPTGLNGNDHYAYIVGYPDKTVRPQNGITRAEVATIFFRLLTDETRNANSTKSNSYSDVAAGAWYNHAVSTLSAMGIVKGDSDGKFNPNAPITRAEFAAIAARFDDKANSTTADFSDIASHWAKNEISAASNNGWINGYPDGTFRPDNKITRAEAMTLVNRVLKRLPETEEDLHDDMIKWSDNSDVSQWFYLAVQEATNSHYYQTKENQFEKWTELRETRDWTELEK